MKIDLAASQFLGVCVVERRLSPNTVEAYRRDIDQFRRFAQVSDVQHALSPENIKAFLAHMLEERALSVATAKRRLACLQALCRYLEELGECTDPFRDWSPKLKRPRRLPRSLSNHELGALVDAASSSDTVARETLFCVVLISATGLRVSELCSIRGVDVTDDGRQMHVSGKGLRDRVVYVGNDRLATDLAARKQDRLHSDAPTQHLFLNSRGRQLKPQTLRRRMHQLQADKSFARPVTPHMLRHTAATRLIERGTDIRFVQRLLGHASIATTEIYTHVTDNALRDAISKADAVGDLVGSLNE